jgi:hypothetical protein
MPPARVIDHFSFVRNHERMLSLFEGELGMPLVWQFSDFGTFESAAVHAGNLLFEMVRPKFVQPSDYAITLLASERLGPTLERLAKLGLRHQAPWRMDLSYPCPWTVPHRDLVNRWLVAQGGSGALWEIAAVTDILPQAVGLLVADYHIDFREVGAKSRAEIAVRSNHPDALGWVNVKSFVLTVSPDTHRHRTQQLHELMGQADGDGNSDARVIFREGPEDNFAGVVARVRSLSKARQFLASRNLLGFSGQNHLTLARHACPDFELRFEAC